jgi:hypothetical protein
MIDNQSVIKKLVETRNLGIIFLIKDPSQIAPHLQSQFVIKY